MTQQRSVILRHPFGVETDKALSVSETATVPDSDLVTTPASHTATPDSQAAVSDTAAEAEDDTTPAATPPNKNPNTPETEKPSDNLTDLFKAALEVPLPLEDVSKEEVVKRNLLSNEQVKDIISQLSTSFGIASVTAQLAIILLFVNGAANQSTPNSITVSVRCTERKGNRHNNNN